MSVRRGWTVVGVLVWVPTLALAQEEPAVPVVEQPAKAPAPKEEPPKPAEVAETATPPIERHRLTLGMSLPAVIGGTNAGALGGLPSASAGYETRMAGPAWFLIALRGGVEMAGTEYNAAGGWFAGGTTGFRVEAPVHDYVEVGGYGRFSGSFGQWSEGDVWQLGAEVGAALHFRPTRLFGVRLCVEVLDWGYSESNYDGVEYGNLYAHLKASPSLDLTFSL